MIGFGTVIDVLGIILGGILGMIFGKHLLKKHREMLIKMCGISVIFIGMAGVMEQMLCVTNGKITSHKGLLLIISLTLGGFIGEILNLDGKVQKFADFLKRKTGSGKDERFIIGFINTSLSICIGALAIVGAINDGLSGDFDLLITKSVLDLVTVLVMTTSFGIGCIYAVIPVVLIQGSITLLAKILSPYITEAVLGNISLLGNVLVFCVGINLLFGEKIKVVNLLPALLLGICFALIPIGI